MLGQKQIKDYDIEEMMDSYEEYETLIFMLRKNYGLTLPINITDDNINKIKKLVFYRNNFSFEEKKNQIKTIIKATEATEATVNATTTEATVTTVEATADATAVSTTEETQAETTTAEAKEEETKQEEQEIEEEPIKRLTKEEIRERALAYDANNDYAEFRKTLYNNYDLVLPKYIDYKIYSYMYHLVYSYGGMPFQAIKDCLIGCIKELETKQEELIQKNRQEEETQATIQSQVETQSTAEEATQEEPMQEPKQEIATIISIPLKLKIIEKIKENFKKNAQITELLTKKHNYIFLFHSSYEDYLRLLKVQNAERKAFNIKTKLKNLNDIIQKTALSEIISCADEAYFKNEMIMPDKVYDKLVKKIKKLGLNQVAKKAVEEKPITEVAPVAEPAPAFGNMIKIDSYNDLLAYGYHEEENCLIGGKIDGIGCTFYTKGGVIKRVITRNGREEKEKRFQIFQNNVLANGWHFGEIIFGDSRIDLFREYMKSDSSNIFSIIPYETIMKEEKLDKKKFSTLKRESRKKYKRYDGFCVYFNGLKFAIKHYKN